MTECRRKAVLFILIDALPWVLVSEAGFLDEIASSRGPLRTVLGYSGAALPTLLSGRMPDEHGHWTMYRHDREGSPFRLYRPLLSLARVVGREGFVRRFIERTLPISSSIKGYHRLYDVPLELLPEYSLAEREDIFSPGGLGPVPTIFDYLQEHGVGYRAWTWRTDEESNVREMLKVIEARETNVLFLYTPELDAVMHARGVFSNEARARLKEQERWVNEAYQTACKHFEDVSLLVFSDHGMTDVTEGHDLIGHLTSCLALDAPLDYLPFYDSTLARFWGRRQNAIEQIADALAPLDYGRVLGRGELERLGLGFNDSSYGELVFLLDPGHVILPSYMGADLPAAMHGYHPDDALSSGAFVSNAPLATKPSHVKDMFEVMIGAVDATQSNRRES